MTTFSFRLDKEKAGRLDALANSLDRRKSWLINEAIDQYLEHQGWMLQEIQEGIADVEAGRTVTFETFKMEMANLIAESRKEEAAKKVSKPVKRKAG